MKEIMQADRFIYSANAVGVAANFSGPHALTGSWASSSLPTIGGYAEATAPALTGNDVLSFTGAKTEITGVAKGGQRETKVTTTVTGLNICNGRLKADKVELIVTATFDGSSQSLVKVDVNANPYTKLSIDNQDYSNVGLDQAMADGAGKDHRKFRKETLKSRKGKYHTHWRGRAHTTLAKGDSRLKFDADTFAYAFVDVPGCGRVYFAEWSQEEDWQRLVGLRIVLEAPNQGEIVIADPDWNGQFYP
jgi:hypothetical protein